jgi:hypothetical protein
MGRDGGTEHIINHWKSIRLDNPPYVHPEDRPDIDRLDSKKICVTTSFEEFSSSERLGIKSAVLELGLYPEPYTGDLERAEILILLLNPGLEPGGYWGEFKRPELRKLLARNLYQDGISSRPFPFIWLDPDLCWHPGFTYWHKKLRDVIGVISEKKFKGSFPKAMQDLSKKIACVDLFPYHSAQFGHRRLLKIPSCEKAKSFISQTAKLRASIIITRQTEEWGVKGGNIAVYQGGQARGAHMTANSLAGKEIQKLYGL